MQNKFKETFESGAFEIDGQEFKINKLISFDDRYYCCCKVMEFSGQDSFAILGDKRLKEIVANNVMLDDMQLSKIKGFFDQPENMAIFMDIMCYAAGGIAYPFLSRTIG